jgi:hypothetical protein
MALQAKKIRVILRWMHIIIGLVLLCYVYSPLSQYDGFRIFVKWVAVPVVILSGVWIWKFSDINKLLNIDR